MLDKSVNKKIKPDGLLCNLTVNQRWDRYVLDGYQLRKTDFSG